MKALLQRVSEASVVVAGETIASVGPGLLVLLGVEPDDGEAEITWLVDKVLGLRIFPDEAKPMNRSVRDIEGELLVVSQFTLAADVTRGRRPSFTSAAPPDVAETRYDEFVACLKAAYPRVATGRFGAEMQVHLVNDGPVTFLIERP